MEHGNSPRIILGAWQRSLPADDAVRLDAGAFTIWRAGRRALLSPTEFRLAAAILASGARLIGRAELTVVLWGDRADGGPMWIDANIAKHLSRARHKLADLGIAIVTVHARGWRAVVNPLLPLALAEAA